MDLVNIEPDRLNAIVQTCPTEKRSALAKALRAACRHLQDSGKKYEEAFELACAMAENWWQLGNELRRLKEAGLLYKGGNPNSAREKIHGLTLAELGVSRKQSQACQRLADRSKAELEEWLESLREKEKFPSLHEVTSKPHVANNSGNNEWYTPPEYIDAARGCMGGIDTDPATSELAQMTVQAETFYTADDDGLQQPWSGNVWMNPPYSSDLIGRFIEKLVEHYEAGDVTAAVVLVNNATDTAWFQQIARASSAICFPSGRIRFIDQNGEPSGAPLQGQAILYLGTDPDAFSLNFDGFGFIARRC